MMKKLLLLSLALLVSTGCALKAINTTKILNALTNSYVYFDLVQTDIKDNDCEATLADLPELIKSIQDLLDGAGLPDKIVKRVGFTGWIKTLNEAKEKGDIDILKQFIPILTAHLSKIPVVKNQKKVQTFITKAAAFADAC